MNRIISLLFASVSLFLACSRGPAEEAMRELDKTIARRSEYIEAFESRNDSLRAIYHKAGTPDAKWKSAMELYQAYYHFSVDSAGRYVMKMQKYASSPEQVLRTKFSEIQLLVWSHDEARALMLFDALDTTGLVQMGLDEQYLARGIEVYTNISRYPRFLAEEKNYADSLHRLRAEYIDRDTVSYYGRKILAQQLRDSGEEEDALELFIDSYRRARKDDYHELTSIEYNIAMLYGKMGGVQKKKEWLSMSAISDFKAPNRDFLSLYELALTLYGEGDLKRAGRYIQIHYDNVLAGGFQANFIRSSQAQNIIVTASLKAERTKRIILVISIIVLGFLLFMVLFLMRVSRRQAKSLTIANKALADANIALEKSNRSLAEVNKIKDNYVFRYMDLSIQYLDRVEESRHELRQIMKNSGVDAMVKELRKPSGFSDYKQFYTIFDQTFLRIFPDFVDGVNALLREDARFEVNGSLPTEIRILATIKLGMDDSGRIASFLKCSLSTVYTYRAKMRNQALCPKEEFEERVKALG